MNRQDILHRLTDAPLDALVAEADAVRAESVGNGVYLRGIVEFSNHCVRNCLYCGLRRANTKITRYRMPPDEVVTAALRTAALGVGTVVLQSGDDLEYGAGSIANIIARIKEQADIKITLSLGERPFPDYELWRDAGADRYLMKHETADAALYDRLHPGKHLQQRLAALRYLKELGYEIGSGFIVGLPGQTARTLADDIGLVRELGVDMCGAGPFLPQADTPLSTAPNGDEDTTLRVLALLRLACPRANLPATTALASLDPGHGQFLALGAGCNVIMPNFTPSACREHYRIYDHKEAVGLKSAKAVIRRAGRTLIRDGGLKKPCAIRQKDFACTSASSDAAMWASPRLSTP
ncbi:hydrogenase maturation protein hyde [hydrocarbon metagenome]|uniref:Hydrogenase maturation protein hyde n=1 Tax=hydrocarbon metagenome TaxID=938273 RepID=A0A0W8G7R8_9ZZZZ